jgi:hypothetical protein
MENWQNKIESLAEGYQKVYFKGRKYGISKKIYNQGKSLKVYAEELGGQDFISFNYYCTSKKAILKPCEMPKERVINFLNNI